MGILGEICLFLLTLWTLGTTVEGNNNTYAAQFPYHFESPGERTYVCPDEWEAHGPDCFKVYEAVQNWDQASVSCHNQGATLLQPRSLSGSLALAGHLEADRYWIGFSFSNWPDLPKSVNWGGNQPNPREEGCVTLLNEEENLYPWHMDSCAHALPFVCGMEGWLEGEFHCFNGEHVLESFTCDGDNDCGDNSDEMNCEQHDRYLLQVASGTDTVLQSPGYSGYYGHNRDAMWLLVGPVGSQLLLEFTELRTEAVFDVVEVYVGGATLATSRYLMSLSGELGSVHPILSVNNYILVTFVSDNGGSAQNSYRFKATCSIDGGTSSSPRYLTSTSVHQTLTFPGTAAGYPSGARIYWQVTAHSQWDLVTVIVDHAELEDKDELLMHSDETRTEEIWSQDDDYTAVTSSGQNLYILLRAGVNEGGKSFKLTYYSGCLVELRQQAGKIKSPGTRGRGYPVVQRCGYSLGVPPEYQGRSMTLILTHMQFDSDGDFLSVYDGNSSADSLLMTYNDSLSGPQAPISAASGFLYVQFQSDQIKTSGSGWFELEFSMGCEDPVFDNNTEAGEFSTHFGSSFSVSCLENYYFVQEEFPGNEVNLSCEYGGQWSVGRLPECHLEFCGEVPGVPNGFVVNVTSVFVGGEVLYGCFDGFTLGGGGAVVECLTGGIWSDPPTCTAAQCPLLDSDDVESGMFQFNNSRGNEFGSVVDVVCDEGYDLTDGWPRILCNRTGQWTGPTEAICTKLRCPVPDLPPHSSLSSSDSALQFEEMRSFECDEGFQLYNSTQIILLVACQADQTVEPIPNCVDIDECNDTSPCDGTCHNTVGSFFCTCPTGFEVNGADCDNIDECQEDNGGCEDLCTDTEGSYTCSCTEEGTVLFTENGLHGFDVKAGETGFSAGDILRINHSCISIVCDDPVADTPFGNGTMLVYKKDYFYVDDSVDFLCNLGYGIQGVAVNDFPERKSLKCLVNGSWDGLVPTCEPIQCDPLSFDGLVNRPMLSVADNETVPFGQTITMTCTVDGRDPPLFNRSRTCLYDVTEQKYALIGDPLECGVIDCGMPEDLSGLQDGLITTTTYNSTFMFQCKDGFTLLPDGADTTVRCREDGKWDLKDLRCTGNTCDDPGRPADGSAQVTSFEEGQVVTFSCERPGFEPSPANMTCTSFGNNGNVVVEWVDDNNVNLVNILCEDKEPPEITNCPDSEVFVLKYDSLNMMATATDNSGVVSASGTSLHASQPLIEDISVTWTVFDSADNMASCTFNVTITSEIPPQFPDGCPESVRIKLNTTESRTVSLSEYMVRTEAGIPGQPLTNTIEPAELTVDGSDLYEAHVITQTARDGLGNEATCVFQAVVWPGYCAQWAFTLKTPEYGDISFTDATATVSCNLGYSFYGYDTSTLTYTCDSDTGEFQHDDLLSYVPECVASTEAEYDLVISIVYEVDEGILILDNAKKALYTDYFTDGGVAAALEAQLNAQSNCVSNDVTVTIDRDVNNNGTTTSKLVLHVKIIFDGSDSLKVHRCSVQVTANLVDPNDILLRDTFYLSPPDEQVTQLVVTKPEDSRIIEDQFVCRGGRILQQEEVGFDTYFRCVPCPPGYYLDGAECVRCERGFYQDEVGQRECKACPNNTHTYLTGTTREQHCYPVCPSPLYAHNSLAPCSPCSSGQYWSGPASCSDCPSGLTAGPQGAASIEQCREPCPAGYFSVDGSGPNCRPCPNGYYSETENSTECTACVSFELTGREGANSSDECQDLNDFCSCENGGLCTSNGRVLRCVCASGYTGEHCEVDINECDSSPCYYGAMCTDLVDGYNCTCPPISVVYMEQHENMDTVSLNPFHSFMASSPEDCSSACQDDDQCVQASIRGDNQICSLFEDTLPQTETTGWNTFTKLFNQSIKSYSGLRCEIEPDDCPANAMEDGFCENGGGCQDLDQGFKCLCRTNDIYTGDSCSDRLEICGMSECANGGTCEAEGEFRYSCQCAEGYTGDRCEVDIDECSSDPCLNGGTCENNVAGFQCDCLPLFSGERCEVRPDDLCSGSPCEVAGVAVGMCVEDYINSGPLCVCEAGYTSGMYVTRWFNTGSPDMTGERETVESHGDVCDGNELVNVTCRDAETGDLHGTTSNQELDCSADIGGLVCYHANQSLSANCSDYEVQYTCRVNGQSCKQIDECALEKCENSVGCTDKVNDYSCTCESGYDGFHCQRDIDECKAEPCGDGGSCTDQVDGFMCQCEAGYTGLSCETPINECAGDPCEAGSSCVDLMADYRCDCLPGYTGKTCSEDIDECQSSPCYHGGNCSQGVDTFSCACTEGWEGDRCQDMKLVCTDGQCKNGGTCYEVSITSHFCDCPTGYTGDTCEDGESICNTADPCQNTAMCDSSSGQVKCTNCPDDYTGEGCERLRNKCLDPDVCRNGGTCRMQTDNSYTCQCQQGFAGETCEEEEEEDSCVGVNCNGGHCENGDTGYLCVCPYRKSGQHCTRDVTRDFDLEFYGEGWVGLLHGFSVNTSVLSLALWVRQTEGEQVLALSSQASFLADSDDMDILTISRNSVTLFDGQASETTLTPDVALDDSSWHSIALILDMDQSKVKVSVDVVNTEAQLTAMDVGRLTGYYGLALGGDEFRGEISNVQVWGRALSNSEVESLYNSRNQDITDNLKTDLVQDWFWGAYSSGSYTHRKLGSERGLTVCKPGEMFNQTADDCQVVTDKTSPAVVMCPSDLEKELGEGNRSVTFTDHPDWPDSGIFEDSEVESNYRKGDVFGPGHYDVVYFGFDEKGNRATCRFDAIVALETCSDVLPVGTYLDEGVECHNMKSLVARLPLAGPVCFEAGVYNIQAPLIAFRVPECGAAEFSAYKRISFSWAYEFCTLTLSENPHQTIIVNKLEEKFRAFSTQLSGSTFCESSDSCENVVSIVELDAERVNRTNVHVTATKVSAEHDQVTMETLLRQAILLKDTFTIEGVCGNPSTVITASLTIQSDTFCEGNTTAVSSLCVTCPVGTAYNSDEQTCDWAPVGHYQDTEGQAHFLDCPHGMTTETYGSVSQQDCFEICEAGYKYNGTDCEACGSGFYQPISGQTFCFSCEIGATTYNTNATSIDDCVDLCDDGQQLMPGGQCEACPQGYYRQRGDTIMCHMCAGPYTTETTGAVTQQQCSVRVCPAGEFAVGDNCTKCPHHSYRAKGMDNCTSCAENYRTDGDGQTSLDACKFFCKPGYYISNHTGSLTCEICARDTYKQETDYYNTNCTSCPPDTPRTAGDGSTSEDDCRFGLCTAGQYVDPGNLTVCTPCPYGTYQDEPDPVYLLHNCTQCPDNKGTRIQGANSTDFCLNACPSGQFMTESGDCVECPQGYFKDNSKGPQFTFGDCELCPVQFITNGTGATSSSECNIGNCTLGQYITSDGVCEDCKVGMYQDEKWQTDCKQCVPVESSTATTGAVSLVDCNKFPGITRVMLKMTFDLTFTDGLRDPTSSAYKALAEKILISYRLSLTNEQIPFRSAYILGFTQGSVNSNVETLLNGSVSEAEKKVEQAVIQGITGDVFGPDLNAQDTVETKETETVCAPGEEFDYVASAVSAECKPCAVGSYQPVARAGLCLPCPQGKTTLAKGSTDESECVRSCDAGQESTDDVNCTPCEVDHIKVEDGPGQCVECPVGRTTYGDDRTQCRAPCAPGTYSSDPSSCRDCPDDQYNALQDQTSCTACPANGTTVGATERDSQDDCKNPCLAVPTFCGAGGTCVCEGNNCTTTLNVSCTCGEYYSGPRCQTRRDPSDDSDDNAIIIGSVVGVVVFCLLLVSLIAYCCKTHRALNQPNKYKKAPEHGHLEDDVGLMNGMYPGRAYPTGGYPGYSMSSMGFWPNQMYSPAMGYYPNYTPDAMISPQYDNARLRRYDTTELQEESGGDFYDTRQTGSLANDPYAMQAIFQRP